MDEMQESGEVQDTVSIVLVTTHLTRAECIVLHYFVNLEKNE